MEVAVASVVLGLVVFGLSRWSHFTPQRLLDIGLGFEVAGAFGISVAQFWNGFVPLEIFQNRFAGIPWESVWIILFPLVYVMR